MANFPSPSRGLTTGSEASDGLRLPQGRTGVVLSVPLAFGGAYFLGDSPLLAGFAALLSVFLMATSLATLKTASSSRPAPASPIAAASLGIRLRSLALDAALCVALMLFAAVPRLVQLGDLPPGLHGDEAVAGIEARRILDEGVIGPYSREALGVPAGLFYWTAGVFTVAGGNTVSLRLAFALVGIATIGAVYVAARAALDRQTAVIASTLLAVMVWHLHFSRVAFIPISLPLFAVLTLLSFTLALRRRSAFWAAATGASLALGFYTYQAFSAFALAFLATAAVLVFLRFRTELWANKRLPLVFAAFAVLTMLPLARYADDNRDVVFGRFSTYSVFQSPGYKAESGSGDRALYLVNREIDYLQQALAEPRLDGIDGSGLIRLVDIVTVGLAVLGIGVAVARIRSPAYLALLMLTALIALSPMLVTEGWYRRSLSLAPLIAVLAALPLGLALDRAQRLRPALQPMAGAAIGLVIVAVAFLNLNAYFKTYDNNRAVGNVYGVEFVPGLEELGRLSDSVYVYLLSDRISYNHPDRQFLAPANPGEDRSQRFGKQGFSLGADRSRDVFYLFLDIYTDFLPLARTIYPGGEVITGPMQDGEPSYLGYLLAGSTRDAPPAAAEQRDEDRRQSLNRIAAALINYRAMQGSYPSTEGRVQTACKYEASDVLCPLRSAAGLTMQDARGDPEDYGYWYASDGKSFTLFASMENPVPPLQRCEVPHLAKHTNLYCLKSE